MLKRNKRISDRNNIIEEIAKEGEEIKGRFIIVRKKKNIGKENRYALNISKKLEKSAVKRNRLRRQIYEIIRLGEKDDRIPQAGMDIMIFARKSLLLLKYEEIEKILIETLKNL